jgi:hypothetical protein
MRPTLTAIAPGTVALCLLLGVGGCTSVGGLLPGKGHSKTTVNTTERDPTEASRALIEVLARMQVDSASTQAELVAAAREAVDQEPTVPNRLRYAAYLALPRQPSSDPVAARRQLSEILAKPELLRPAEQVIATVLLDEVDDRLVLQSEANHLRQELSNREKDRQTAVAPKHLPTDADEIARLKRALDEAQRKLDAVTQVERSMLGRGNPPKP